MGLQSIVRWLVPRDEVFFGLIERLTELSELAAKELVKVSEGVPAEQVFEGVRIFKHQADKLVYEAEEHFAKVFVTPIDREDIQALIVEIDDIIELIHVSSRAFVLHRMPQPTPAMTELMKLLVTLGGVLRSEIPALARRDYDRLLACGRVLREHERTGDTIFREAVAELFHNPKIDAKVLVRDKGVLEELENAIDKFEIVADRLKHLAVKNG